MFEYVAKSSAGIDNRTVSPLMAGTFAHPREIEKTNFNSPGCERLPRQGSPWLRWILVEAAMKAIREDVALRNFYTRVRKRSSAKIARVATARKLAEICWKRLRRWQRTHAEQAA